ncbi:MAG: hypothetical protein RIB45_14250 [Marivibrio sp.]|uniref:tetratricopeptide repeat protein n=1 Tax=Marivibrio sp. TaxID=2039719 RepID=UPI0032ED637A
MSKSCLISAALVAAFLVLSAPSAAQDLSVPALEAALDEAYAAEDWAQARDLARRLADMTNNPYYDGLYGFYLVFGYGGQAEPAHGAALIKEAARAGDLSAQTWLGELYVQGRGVDKDIDRGVCVLRHAGLRGSLEAMRQFVATYRKATTDFSESRDLFGKTLRAAGDPMALFADALYLLGNEVEADDLQGLTLMVLADRRISERFGPWAVSLIRNQADATITDFHKQERAALVDQARKQADARVFKSPSQKPDDEKRFAACFTKP